MSGPHLPAGTLTFLFSDIEGSTRLLRTLGHDAYVGVLERHNALLRAAIAAHGGVEVDRQGDAFFVVFESAAAAVRAAVHAQRALAGEAWPADAPVRVRIGLHTGEARPAAGGYVGLAVHEAARIGDAGHGGQILLSSTTAHVVESALPRGVRLADLGDNRLADLERPQRLFQVLVEGLPGQFPRLRTAPAAAARVPDGPALLERETDLEAIRDAVEAACAGAGGLLAIEGEAGIGKSRLLAVARATGVDAGMEVLFARGAELEHDFSYGIVRQLLEPLLAGTAPEERAELLSGAASLAAPLFDPAAGPPPDGEDGTFSVLHGLFWLIGNLAGRRPLLLAVDDLHWADAASLRWLAYLARRLDGQQVLVAAALRPAEQGLEPELLAELVGDPAAIALRPAPLSVEATSVLVRDALGEDADPAFCLACRQATGGNPLFLRSLLDALRQEGLSARPENAERVYEIGPQAVSRAVHLRLSRLPAEVSTLARAVAVLGSAPLPLAAALAGLDRELAGHAATTLARNGILRLDRELAFVHPVVRAAIYADLALPEREEAHAQAARLLAAERASSERVAAHLLLTSPIGEPFVRIALGLAADESLRRGDPGGAVAYLARALEEGAEGDERRDVLVQLGMAERLLDSAAAAGHLSAALDLEAHPVRRGRIALELGRTLFYTLRVEEAVGVLERAIAELDDADAALERRLEAGLLSVTSIFPPLFPIARRQLERIERLELGDDLGSRLLEAIVAYVEARRNAPRAAVVARAERALAGGPLYSDDSPAYVYAAYALELADRYDAALAVYEDAFVDARLRGSIAAFAVASTFRAHGYLGVGRLADALEDARNGLEASRAHGLTTAVPYAVSHIADVLLELGDVDGAAKAVAELDAAGDTVHRQWFFLDSRGRVRIAQGRAREGVADLREAAAAYEALEGSNPGLLPWRSTLALALRGLGETDEAGRLAEEEVALARDWGAARPLGRSLRAAGLVAGGEEGLGSLREAVAVLGGSPAALERAKALVALGAALRRGNRRAEARDVLREGLDLAHLCGARPLEDEARTELAATGARPRRLAVSGVDALTPSERRVAEMAAGELTNREIAQALFVTPKTVEVHLSSVYRKLGIASRTQLARALPAAVAK